MQITNNSIKDYYINLQTLYNNSVNMLSAMQQALTSNASEVSVSVVSSNDVNTTIRIPSFLYLENKIEQLDNNFSNLFQMPESGEAWFEQNANMYKVKAVKANTAPLTPTFNTSVKYASITDNNILKDMVSPKTFMKLNITNLPENIEKMFMKKIVFTNSTVYTSILNMNLKSYEDYVSALYNFTQGIDYEEYDSVIDLPVKTDVYSSHFEIQEIKDSWVDETSTNDGHSHTSYKIVLDTLQYHNQEDQTIEYTLRAGDYITLANNSVVYKVKTVNIADMSVIVEESFGHVALQPFFENSEMYMSLYNTDYSDFHYVNIPLEENQYICVFVGTIYNNVRSLLSEPCLIDLSTITMVDANGQQIYDSYGNPMSYMDYYEKYCVNIGDLILGLTESAQPQISNYTNNVLKDLQDEDTLRTVVTTSINAEQILQVVPINKHLVDNTTTEEIINLHTQKNEINAQLTALQENIDNVYSTLVNTDFSQELTITQESLRSQLQEYYTQRTTLQKQLIAIIDNINSASDEVVVSGSDTKYRVRGIAQVDYLESTIQSIADSKVVCVGMECEYKYKSPTKDTTAVTNINSNIFTDWVRMPSIDKQRKLVFNGNASAFSIEYEDYSSTQNVTKWNQIDIPITQGEDVVIRVRYKYNIGQPFINLYTPWSEEIVVVFPTEFVDDVEVTSILADNQKDTVSAKFNNTLINEGYQEHITNSLTVNNVTFYHSASNIYSGFTTSDNQLISLDDKLHTMSTDLEAYKALIDSEINRKYQVYLTYDDVTTELFNNTTNRINIYNTEHISDSFIKKKMNIVIKNVGEVNCKFYSQFPGNIDIPLLLTDIEYFEKYISDYERVPLYIDNTLSYQTLGQWIYFRKNNPYTKKSIYFDTDAQNLADYRALSSSDEQLTFTSTAQYIKEDYSQTLLGYRKRNASNIVSMVDSKWIGLNFVGGKFERWEAGAVDSDTLTDLYAAKPIEWFMYKLGQDNNYLTRFEDISGTTQNGQVVYLDSESSISNFIATNNVVVPVAGKTTFNGAFLYPDVEGRTNILTEGGENDYMELEVSKTVSIPVTFEYYIDGEDTSKITKALYFDLRDSLISEPKHYMIEITANYDYTSTGALINSTSLLDDATE